MSNDDPKINYTPIEGLQRNISVGLKRLKQVPQVQILSKRLMEMRPNSETPHTCRVDAPCGRYIGQDMGDLRVFRGIRYALPLSKRRRFLPPVPVKQQPNRTFEALRFGEVCPQPSFPDQPVGMDCLNLNIWCGPEPEAAVRRRSVLFYVHGGSFLRGSGCKSTFDGSVLVREQNLLVVTCNYRLGILGFVDLRELNPNYVPNRGILDVLCALNWVRENIASFGGDPEKITVMGESAGGTIAALLPLTSVGASSIARVVTMSATPGSVLYADDARHVGRCLLSVCHCQNAEQLEAYPLRQLVLFSQALIAKCGLGVGTFQPVIDGLLFDRHPLAAARQGKYPRLPFLIGNTGDELSVLLNPLLNSHWKFEPVRERWIKQENPATIESINKLYKTYYDSSEMNTQVLSDSMISVWNLCFAKLLSSAMPVWLYRFDYRSTAARLNRLGAVHASDLPFMFGNLRSGIGLMILPLPNDSNYSDGLRISQEMREDLARFINEGTLPWPALANVGLGTGAMLALSLPARHYDVRSSVLDAMPARLFEAYQNTNYYRFCCEISSEDDEAVANEGQGGLRSD